LTETISLVVGSLLVRGPVADRPDAVIAFLITAHIKGLVAVLELISVAPVIAAAIHLRVVDAVLITFVVIASFDGRHRNLGAGRRCVTEAAQQQD